MNFEGCGCGGWLLNPGTDDGNLLEQRLDIRSQDNGTDSAEDEDGEDVFPVDVLTNPLIVSRTGLDSRSLGPNSAILFGSTVVPN